MARFGLLSSFVVAILAATVIGSPIDTRANQELFSCNNSYGCKLNDMAAMWRAINKYNEDPIVETGALNITAYTSLDDPNSTVIYECEGGLYPLDRPARDIGLA